MNTKAGPMNTKNVAVVHFQTIWDILLKNICRISFLLLLERINQKFPYLLIPLSNNFFFLFLKLNEQWNYPIILTLETLRKGLEGIFSILEQQRKIPSKTFTFHSRIFRRAVWWQQRSWKCKKGCNSLGAWLVSLLKSKRNWLKKKYG